MSNQPPIAPPPRAPMPSHVKHVGLHPRPETRVLTWVDVLEFHPDGDRMRVRVPQWPGHKLWPRRTFLMPIPDELRTILDIAQDWPMPLHMIAEVNTRAPHYKELIFTKWDGKDLWALRGKKRRRNKWFLRAPIV